MTEFHWHNLATGCTLSVTMPNGNLRAFVTFLFSPKRLFQLSNPLFTFIADIKSVGTMGWICRRSES